MDLGSEAKSGKLLTVKGPISAEEMGFTLPHEHILTNHQGPKVDLSDPLVASEELQLFYRYGGRTLVDMTNIGLNRQPHLLKKIAEETCVNIVMGTGFYKDAWLPPEIHDMNIIEMTDLMVNEILYGEKESGIHAGVIGEIGVSRSITPTEERVLASAAHAQRKTGVAINIHFDIGTTLPEYHHAVDILDNEGADLKRVILDHFICRPDEIEMCRELTKRGCTIEFDLWGQEKWTKIYDLTGYTLPEVQIASLRWFINAGMLEQIVISQDIGNHICWRKFGGYGYIHIMANLVPLFQEYGITDEHLRVLMIENPKRLFPIQSIQI